jgi:hypothetical protein
MSLEHVALILLILVAIILFYGIIVIHDIPYEIAVERNHPHQDAIHVAGWVSLFTLHVIWPFLWVWATLWREDRGWGFQKLQEEQHDIHHRLGVLADRITALEQRTVTMEPVPSVPKAVHAQQEQAAGDAGEEKS